MTIMSFQEYVESKIRRKLKLKINNNCQTMLSVKWEADCTKVSMHRMFLEAPKNIMDNLACYIERKHKVLAPEVKAYIQDNMRKLDYSHRIRPSQLCTQGDVYNLKKLYDQINQQYFNGKVNLYITWFGHSRIKSKKKITYGLYIEPQKLIKIHRFLDNISVPDYVLAFVIYHEMLHHVYPTYVDKKGRHRAHDKTFKQKEEQFQYFKLAQEWMEQFEDAYFGY